MRAKNRALAIRRVVLAALFMLAASSRPSAAQTSVGFTLDQLLSHPFPEHLTASPIGSTIAWTLNERGVRNIYIAQGPEFQPRRLTIYNEDDGRDLRDLSFSDDGRYLVYVRGASRESVPKPATDQPSPSAAPPVRPSSEVWSITVDDGSSRRLGSGETPLVAPRTHRVAFLKGGRLWIAPLDGSTPEESVYVRGTAEALAWSPDGETLAFASNRESHGFITLFTRRNQPVKYHLSVDVERFGPGVVARWQSVGVCPSTGSGAIEHRLSRPRSMVDFGEPHRQRNHP